MKYLFAYPSITIDAKSVTTAVLGCGEQSGVGWCGWGLSALAREAISTKGHESFAERVGAGPFDFAQDKCGKSGADLSAEIPRSGMKAEGATYQTRFLCPADVWRDECLCANVSSGTA